jgi:anti-sigma B factor antagonist
MQSRFFRLDVDADVATVDMLRDRLTEEDNIEEFGQELTSLVDKQNFKKIIVCMRKVRYLTSSVIGKLIMLHRRLGRSDGQLVLTDVQPEVEEILEAGQLMSYFTTAPDVGAAKVTLA